MKHQKRGTTQRTRAVLNNIRDRRNHLGYSQEYVALEAGMCVRWYQKLENGSSRMTIEDLYRIADVLKVKPNYFFCTNEDSQNELYYQCQTALQQIFQNNGHTT